MVISMRGAESRKAMVVIWWILLIIVVAYSGFAFDMFRIELNQLSGSVVDVNAKARRMPLVFMVHALLGGIGLLAGVFQFSSRVRHSYMRVHRFTGWVYLLAIWGASLSGVLNAIYFDVPGSAKLIFIGVGSWWFSSTTLAFLKIRQRAVEAHQVWMIRSYATSLFFITFPFFVPTLQMLVRDSIAWPVGLTIALGLNVVVGEVWIRRRISIASY